MGKSLMRGRPWSRNWENLHWESGEPTLCGVRGGMRSRQTGPLSKVQYSQFCPTRRSSSSKPQPSPSIVNTLADLSCQWCRYSLEDRRQQQRRQTSCDRGSARARRRLGRRRDPRPVGGGAGAGGEDGALKAGGCIERRAAETSCNRGVAINPGRLAW